MAKELMEKVFAYNRSVLAQEAKAQKVEEIRVLLQSLGNQPTLAELLVFLGKLRAVLQGSGASV